jgi:hypothetical protein
MQKYFLLIFCELIYLHKLSPITFPHNEAQLSLNSQLTGKQIQIHPLADCLYPMVIVDGDANNMILHTNFGDDLLAKPFKYDINKCPGLGLD